ncbi:flagellar hook-length control protein FliK [Accumulibacter sp.]|uniref:flagellar hook-length control protein FliK n=1 Tax=Accumulibacter sp. TaxID=2053492 RepID=UPI0025F06543|nr:flagellar hook-length control protein FliK [Accumulibacter sp.]MCM8612916.1 flagellar hook-length control protein FliK [Accumulibacter sp.]MCM8636625.1 flagellar hook-length control protein FliK [Accumulibacter sp.]MCM8639419.1 flagellar hook-length control protein FliK [Accumulibacter sp.]
MTISIVTPALITQPARATVTDDDAARTTNADEAGPGNDFLDILLALPAMTASAPAPAADIADAQPPAAEAGTPTATVEMLVLSQQLPQTAYRPPPAGEGGSERVAGAPAVAGEALANPPPARSGPAVVDPVLPTGDSRQPAAAATEAGPRAATFAVPDLIAMPSEKTAVEADEPLAPAVPAPATAPPAGAGSTVAGALAMPAAATRTHTLQTPLRDPSWAGEFGQKLLWFANNEQQGAKITVHPPQLGVIEISLNLDRDGATAHFASPSAEVRSAIEAAMPRLREMFAGAGIDIGQLSVGSHAAGQQSQGQGDSSPATRRQPDAAILGSDPPAGVFVLPAATRHGQTMIDVFA